MHLKLDKQDFIEHLCGLGPKNRTKKDFICFNDFYLRFRLRKFLFFTPIIFIKLI